MTNVIQALHRVKDQLRELLSEARQAAVIGES